MRTLLFALLLSLLLVGLGGCNTGPARARTMSSLERRAAMIRGTVDNQWEAVDQALERGDDVHPRYVYTLAQLRYAALAIELRTAMLELYPEDIPKAEKVITSAEEVLPKVLATPMNQPPEPGVEPPTFE